MIAKKKPKKTPRHGWQVCVPQYALESPTNFDHEYAQPRVFFDKTRAEAARVLAEREYLVDLLPRIEEHVVDWNYEDEVADALLAKLPVDMQRAFIRAFLPGLWAARRQSRLASSDYALRTAFRQAAFAAPYRASALAWKAAHILLDPYLTWPYLRRVRVVT